MRTAMFTSPMTFTDTTPSWLQPCLRVIHTRKNGAQLAARSTGIQASQREPIPSQCPSLIARLPPLTDLASVRAAYAAALILFLVGNLSHSTNLSFAEKASDEETSHIHDSFRTPVRVGICAKWADRWRRPVNVSKVGRKLRWVDGRVGWQFREHMEERRRTNGDRGAGKRLCPCEIEAAGHCVKGSRHAASS